MNQLIDWTGERYVPWMHESEIHYEHLHRYRFAQEFVKSKKVLDLACGEGYGSAMLAEEAEEVIGIDIDEPTIKHASSKYKQGNIRFIKGSITNIPLNEEKVFDVIVCFEAIEHIEDHEGLMKEVKRLLARDGIFIVSTPNKYSYSDQPNYQNPYHVKELYFEEFDGLLSQNYKNIFYYGQRIYPSSNLFPLFKEQGPARDYTIEKADDAFLFVPSEKKVARYFIAVASDGSLDRTITSGNSYMLDLSETLFRYKDAQISNLDAQISNLERVIRDKEIDLEEHKAAIREKDATLDRIYSSHGWKALQVYYRMREKFFPPSTKRRLLVRVLFGIIFKPGEIIRNINVTNLKKAVRYFIHCDPIEMHEKIEKKLSQTVMESQESRIEIEFDKHLVLEEIEDLDFPVYKQPVVSIIIPVWNKWQYTYQCLRALLKHDEVPYEVVVVDNASTDETPKMFAKVKNVKIIKNSSNRGFNEACNMGAQSSQGDYVVFLNNDTLVTTGWLKSMVELAERDASIGLVGAKLIFPDGKLQEAGGIVWNDPVNLAQNYGKYDNYNRYEYNYVKEVDYCSAACMLVKKELFERIGLFDKQFAPAYFEDADLAFSVRKLGFKVMYQPKSEVVHLEGATAGTNIAKGYKRYQGLNQKKFFEKWKNTLKKEHCRNGVDVFLARDRSQNKKLVLVIDHHVPTFDKDAGSLRMFYMLKILSELGYKVVFVGANPLKMEPYTQALQQIGVEVVYYPYILSAEDYIRKFGRYFNVVILSRPHISIAFLDSVKNNCTKAKIIYDTVDLAFLRESRRAKVENNKELLEEAEKLKSTELYLARNSDITFVVSSAEKDLLLKEDPSLNIRIVSIIHHITKPQKSFSERKGILFVGGFVHIPNIDAVTHFVETTFPILKRKLPDLTLYIVGSNPPKEVLALKSKQIIVAGYIEDLTSYFEGCKVFIAPLRYGAGVKGKIIHSMSHGLPVVTTPIGTEGIECTDGKDILIADEPEKFAEKVTLLYTDENLWNKLSQNSIANIEKHFSYEVAKNKIQAILEGNRNKHEGSHVSE